MAYNPSDHTASNKAYGTRGKPVEARTYFFDKGVTFRYRPYMSLAEVLTNLPTSDDRRGNFEVIVNTGGTLQSSGYITGGVNQAFWFRDGLADDNLVIKDTDLSDYYTQEEVNALFNDLAPVASSGSYNDLTDKPNIPALAPVQSVNGRTGTVTGLAEQSSLTAHVNDNNNPHNVTKAQVGLGQVDNVPDLQKPISSDQQTALDGKVDKVNGKGLSSEDYTLTEKSKLAGIEEGATQNETDAYLLDRTHHTGSQPISTITGLQASLDDKIPLAQKAANNGVATLDGGGKVPVSQLPSGAQTYKGTWDASTNTPTLTNGTGSAGDTYRVIEAGTVDFGAGNITFVEGDDVIYNGTIWQRNPSSQTVVSVNGQQGAVVLDKGDIGLGDVDNTKDTDKPVSTPQQAALDLKVDKITGKGLSTNDFTDADKTNLDNQSNINTGDQDLSGLATTTALNSEITNRQSGDQANATAISNEATARQNEDALLYGLIGNEINERQNADALKQDKTDNSLPTASKTVVGAIGEILTQQQSDFNSLEDEIANSTTRLSAKVYPSSTDGSVSSVQIPEVAGMYIMRVIVGGAQDYSIGSVLNEDNKVATFNPSTNTFTFPSPLYTFVEAEYRGIQGGDINSPVLTVNTYEDMLAVATGSRRLQIFVVEASAYNEPNEFYDYVPTKGVAYLGIDFNYTE